MAINAFGGAPGSGKSYGVIEHVILPAIASGRFVITNIAGVDVDAIYEYVAKNSYKGKIFCIGHIRHCGDTAPGEAGFFPGIDAVDVPCPIPHPELKTVNGGDLVVIDEVTRYWPMGEKVSKEAQLFFREHRHFANVLGQTCDLVVITPDLSEIHRAIRGKLELSSVTHKLKSLGLERYVVRLFRGSKLTGKPQSVNGPYKFQKEIYSLYKSNSHKDAKEARVDGRQNIFASKLLWAYVVGVIVAISGGSYLVWKFLHPTPKTVVVANPVSGSAVNGPSGVSPNRPIVINNIPPVSDKWRVVGTMVSAGLPWVVMSDSDGRLRLESPSAFSGSGSVAIGEIDGTRVSTWSGDPSPKGLTK